MAISGTFDIYTRVSDVGGREGDSYGSPDGAFDSENLTPESEMVFNMLNTVGQHQRKRNRAFRLAASKRASRRGVYLAKKPPLGYIRAEDGPNYLPDPERDGRRIVTDP